jgi:chromosomal replication initiation ATPase DnaA
MDTFGDRLKSVISVAMQRADDPEYQRKAEELRVSWDAFEARSRELDREVSLESWGIPRAAAKLLEAPGKTQAIEAVGTWLKMQPPVPFLLLLGARGVGKTVAAWWAVALRAGRYVTAMDLVRAGSFDRDFWESLRSVPLLAIDELGMEGIDQSGWFFANLYDLLDHRMSRNRRTILLSNLDVPAFKARYCAGAMERLYDRLRTTGKVVEINGESMRKHWSEGDEP